MSKSSSELCELLHRLSAPISDALSDAPSQSAAVSVKSILQPLLHQKPNPNVDLRGSIRDFTLACALLSASQSSGHELLMWIPKQLAAAAESAVVEFSEAYSDYDKKSGSDGLVAELMAEVMPVLKERIKESSVDKSMDADEVSAASARAPVGFAIVAAYQFRWFVTQIDYSRLGELCALAVPCGLTALDHWSPEVKGQGMISFIHIAKKVDVAHLVWCQDAILDACRQNMASSDEIWHLVVEMSVLVVTRTQQNNPRSAWYDKILNEMLSHLERQPRNKERRVAWLRYVEPLLNGVGLVLLAHFKRIFPLFFKWIHADDDETVLLVLKQIETVMKLTWIRNTPYVERLVDELAALHKEASMKVSREDIRILITRILILLQQCKGQQFEASWSKHRNDPNLATISPSLSRSIPTIVSQ